VESRSTASTLTKAVASPFSRNLDNPSAYLIDSGLWTACKESRRVLKRELKRKERRQIAPSSSDQAFLDGQGAVTFPGPATFRTIDNPFHYRLRQPGSLFAGVFSGAQCFPSRNQGLVSETMTRWPHIQRDAHISHSVVAAISQLSRCGLSQPGPPQLRHGIRPVMGCTSVLFRGHSCHPIPYSPLAFAWSFF
jgi:hypothetical protein